MSQSAFDGEFALLEKVLDLSQQFQVFAGVHAVSLAILSGLEHGEFSFPVTQQRRAKI
jgi:hypothetical protein